MSIIYGLICLREYLVAIHILRCLEAMEEHYIFFVSVYGGLFFCYFYHYFMFRNKLPSRRQTNTHMCTHTQNGIQSGVSLIRQMCVVFLEPDIFENQYGRHYDFLNVNKTMNVLMCEYIWQCCCYNICVMFVCGQSLYFLVVDLEKPTWLTKLM